MPEAIPVPPAFLERMSRFLGEEFPAFAAALAEQPVSGLRVNTLKLSVEEFQKIAPFSLREKIPWCDSAFALTPTSSPNGRGEEVREPGKHPYHLAGLYYLQDPSAMAPAELLGPQPGERILDLAAAPGGKTTHLASLMSGKGLLVANEIKDKRVGHLAVNVERWGAVNVVITNETPERLADHFGPFFDRVLVDAPCSGEGMFRKGMGARQDWSLEMIEGCSIRQRNILRVAAKLLRPGGYLLYSTCTFAPEEDEAVINELLNGQANKGGLRGKRPEFEVVELPLLDGFMCGRPEWASPGKAEKSIQGAVRLFPHRIRGEGHFVCLLRRLATDSETGLSADKRPGKGMRDTGRLVVPSQEQSRLWDEFAGEVLKVKFPAERLRVRGERLYFIPAEMPDFGNLRLVHPGVWLGTFKKVRFEPAHPLPLFLRRGQVQNELVLASADSGGRRSPLRAFLAGESIPSVGPAGWTLVTVDGWPLGWGKRVQDVVKNHYPRGWQIYS